AGFDGSIKGTGEADIKDAAALGQLAGQKLSGQLTLKLEPFALQADGSGGGDITLETQNVDFGDDLLNRLAGGSLAADASLLLPKGGGFAVPSLTVTPTTGAYSLHGSIAQGATGILSGEAQFDAADAAALLPGTATGKLAIGARLSGDANEPHLSLSAALTRGSIAGVAANKATLEAVMGPGDTGPLALRFDGPGGKAALDATLGLPQAGGARLDALRADIFGAKFAGALAVSPEGLASGAIKGELVALKPLSELAGIPLDGAGNLSFVADGTGGKQNAALSFSARRLSADPGVVVSLDHATFDAAFHDIAGKATVEAQLAALSGQAGITHLTHVAIGARGPLDKLALRADIAGTREAFKPQPLSFTTDAVYDGGANTLMLAQLRLALGDASLSLAKPASLALSNGIAAKGIALDMTGSPGSGRLSADMTLARRSARLHVKAESTPLELAALLLPVDSIDGTANGTADLDSGRGTAALAFRFDKVAISQEQEGDRPAFNASLDGKWAKGRFDIKARAAGVSTEPFDLAVSLPVIRDPAGAWPQLASRGAVSGTLNWQGPIASLAALADLGNQQITGTAQVALTAGGDISAPLIDGSASLVDGGYENFDSGTVLKKLSLKLEGSRSRSLHFTLAANDGGQGRVEADGAVSLAQGIFPAISIGARFANAHLVRRSDADVSVDGAVQLIGPRFPPDAEAPLTLKGALTTTSAQIRIPESLSASIPQIEVVEINGEPARAAMPGSESAVPLQLDLAVKIDKPARVSGRGLDSLWTGDFNVTGPATEPVVTGTLTSLRGALDFAGKTFTLTKGSVHFLGETPIDPNLDVALDYKRSDLAATVSVTGQSSSPSIVLSSTPDLPRDELLSRILFNKGVGELSATEGVQLANTLAQLSGSGFGVSGAGILDRMQQSLGLDVLRIDSAQSGATTLAAGKYIEKGVYVGVEQGALASDSSVKVEITVTPQISVDTRLGQNASGDVGINWKWDY
ncbi:MAG TPA: translocation/assembly module TamB domain-containing protein, partial [Parvibaculum sp.]